ncbi:MAG TPA: tRNA (adenosine(37)-N6)-dimethylallyltransferase MiaA [Candidatus Saccharimonadales bacterium]|nr:tRNA (adenosine(37)-N6)-dimethylallyltransferase MiaA [Candidatus Saccharimonadales bacterium]
MDSRSTHSPLVVIVGQTASGKSDLALELARRFNGEIIAADSRTVYTGMDIGTAKPTLKERQTVRHHLIDVVTPDQAFSVAKFQQMAEAAIRDIGLRGKLPILVGGTGLYIDALLYSFKLRPPADVNLRQELSQLSVEALQTRLMEQGIALPANKQNPRHLIRSLETKGVPASRSKLRSNTLLIGIQVSKEVLQDRIRSRVEHMVEQGFAEEARSLRSHFGADIPALQAPGYKAFRGYVEGVISLEEAKAQFIQNDLQYAKRQKTWFKRNQDIHWINETAEAIDLVTTFLNNL